MSASHITFVPGMMGGEATINGMRMPVAQVQSMMDRGMSDEEIRAAFPFLTSEDLDVVRWFDRTFRVVHRRQPRRA